MRIAIIGTGFAGIGAAIQLKRAGFADLVLFERSDDIGGTWRDNTYPGCACDIQSHLYSFSFELNPEWSRTYPAQPEIRQYLLDVVERHGIRPLVRFGAEVAEARWDDSTSTWAVTLSDGSTAVFDVVVSATGPLSRPKDPDVPGLDRFTGTVFHSARWNHHHDLQGERVAVIGTGASAIQLVPEIAPIAERTTVFQRTPPWVLPRDDRPYTERQRRRFRRAPALTRLERARIYLRQELLVFAFLGLGRTNQRIADGGRQFIEAQVSDPTLRAQVTPDYAPGCKRLLISNDWYPTLGRPDVDLVDAAVTEVTESSVVSVDSAGTRMEHEVDTIICATGFAATEFLAPMRVVGRDDVELSESWVEGAATRLGIAVHGFPNFWMLAGPTTGLGHNSIIVQIEAQLHTIIGALRHQRRGGLASLEVRRDVQDRSYRRHTERMAKTVWASGCDSWYLSADGRNDTLWPGSTVEYWWRTRRFRPREFTAR